MARRDSSAGKLRESVYPRADTAVGQEEAQRRQEFEQWVAAIVPQLMSDLRALTERKVHEFRKRTGAELTVKAPNPDRPRSLKAPWLGYFTLSLGSTLLHLYASRGGGTRLSVHLIPDDASWVPKNHRVLSQAGCLVVRKGEGYELRYLRGDPDGTPRQVISADTLIQRALDALVNAHIQGGP